MNARFKTITILAGAAIAAASTFGGVASAATNLLSNGNFIPTTAGWYRMGTGEFASMAGVGGVLRDTKVSMDGSRVVAYQCVSLAETNAHYTLTGSIRVPAEQDRGGVAGVEAHFYSKAGCAAGSIVESFDSPDFSDDVKGWSPLSMNLARKNGHDAKSLAVVLTVDKASTNRIIKKGGTFEAHFKNFSLVQQPSGGISCLAFGGGCTGEDDGEIPDGPVVCVGCEDDPEPAPPVEPAVPDAPVEPAAPVEPVAPVEPAAPDAPAQPSVSEEPASDAPPASGSSESPSGNPTSGSSNSPSGNPTSGGGNSGGKPQAKPTLEPQKPGLPNAVTPTPVAPATGGSSTSDPASDYALDQGEPQNPANLRGNGDGSASLPLAMFAGGIFLAILGMVGVGLGIRSLRRE